MDAGMEPGRHLAVPAFDGCNDSEDLKYIGGLSTILVATIQEVKDRVSQIEFLFCNQLFPHFQSKSKLFQRMHANIKKAAEDEWREREAVLLQQIDEHIAKRQDAEEQLDRFSFEVEETRKKLVAAENCVRMHTNIKKAAEDDWREREAVLLQQIDEHFTKRQDAEKQLDKFSCKVEETRKKLLAAENCVRDHEFENSQLTARLESLLNMKDEAIACLKRELDQVTSELAKEKENRRNLLKLTGSSDQELIVEREKRRVLTEEFTKLKSNYKQLKSQYNFLIRKLGDPENYKARAENTEDETRTPILHPNKRNFEELEDVAENVLPPSIPRPAKHSAHTKNVRRHETGSSEGASVHGSLCIASTSIESPHKHILGHEKSARKSHEKQIDNCWKNTRSRVELGGLDPHDDFLDTPMEVVRNMNRDQPEELHVSQDLDVNNSDDETQDLNAAASRMERAEGKQLPPSKNFKYVESVRKRSDRENLKGIECKQCKKFYDAVLPEGRADGSSGNSTMRCEHLDGVSRHRYRYAPPLTPEGFWNIGFDSEL